MKDIGQNKITTALIVLATLILAVVAVVTSIRIFNVGQKPIAPNVPESMPEAAPEDFTAVSCQVFTFTINLSPSPTLSITPTLTPSPNPSATQSPTPIASNSPSPTTTSQPTTTPTNQPTTTPTTVIAQASPTTTPSGATLPDAGINLPTLLSFSIGILLLMLAIVVLA